MPCGHDLDFGCAVDLINSLERYSKRCLLCRTHIIQVRWDFIPNGGYDYFVLGSSVDDTGPFIREDEEIREGMDIAEIARRHDLRIPRAMEDKNIYREVVWEAEVQRDNQMFIVKRKTSLNIYQQNTKTASRLVSCILFSIITKPVAPTRAYLILETNTLDLITSKNDSHLTTHIQVKDRKQVGLLATAHAQIRKLFSKIPNPDFPYYKLEILSPRFHVRRESRNFEVAAYTILTITKPSLDKEDTIIHYKTTLIEDFTEDPLSEVPLETNNDMIRGLHGMHRRGVFGKTAD